MPLKKSDNLNGFTIIELMVVIAVIALLSAIAIPNFISYRNKAFCSAAESDANQLASALADYFADPAHVTLPTVADVWAGSLSGPTQQLNTATFSGTVAAITITVTDTSRRCPVNYQNGQPDWDGNNMFTKVMQ